MSDAEAAATTPGAAPARAAELEGQPRSPFDDLAGVVLTEVSPQRTVAVCEADARHHQPTGLTHGGVYATMVETVASVGAWTRIRDDGLAAVGLHNATDFLRPHRGGTLTAVGGPVHVGRTQQLWEVAVTDDRDRLVARGQVRLAHVDAQTGAPASSPAAASGGAG